MIVLAPGVETDWFLSAAVAYWNTFRPIVTTYWDFINFIPYDRSLAVTLITPQDMAGNMITVIKGQYPNILLDLIVVSDVNVLTDMLNKRVWANQRFG